MSQIFSNFVDAISKNYKATLIGVALTLGSLWWLAQSFGFNTSDLTRIFIEHKSERDTVAAQLGQINEKVDNAEAAAHDNHTRVLSIVQGMGGSDQSYQQILQMSAENQDLIRAFVEFGRIYASLVKLGEHTKQTHEHLSSLYQALLEVTADDPLEKASPFNDKEERRAAKAEHRSLCQKFQKHSICKARDHLISIEREITDFPRSVRDDVEIEVLRYLSYCSARAEESNQQRMYTERAEEIYRKANEADRIDGKLYRRKYFWIHYSNLVFVVSQGLDNYEAEGWNYYNQLRKKLATEHDFLLRKLLQHANLITDPDKKALWQSFIERSRVS